VKVGQREGKRKRERDGRKKKKRKREGGRETEGGYLSL